MNSGGKVKNIKKPILFVTLGYPGSGKTFFARRFAKEFGLYHLNSDRTRLEIILKPKYTIVENAGFFRVMDFIAGEFLQQGNSVIYDANSTKIIYRKCLQKIAKKRNARYILLWIQTPVDLALRRIKKRKELKSELMRQYHRPIDDSVLFRLKDEQENHHREPHIVINGKLPYRKQKESVIKFLRKIK